MTVEMHKIKMFIALVLSYNDLKDAEVSNLTSFSTVLYLPTSSLSLTYSLILFLSPYLSLITALFANFLIENVSLYVWR